MKRLQAFKFELRTQGAQQQQMRRFAGSCRIVYNKGLALQKARFDAGEKKLNYAELCKLLTHWRNRGELILVPPQNTSRRCPQCEHVSTDNRRTQERFACVECGSCPISG